MNDPAHTPSRREPAGCLQWFTGGFVLGALFAIARNPGGALACGCMVLVVVFLVAAVIIYAAFDYLAPLGLIGGAVLLAILVFRNRRTR